MFFQISTQFGKWFHRYLQENVRGTGKDRGEINTPELGAKATINEIFEHRKDWTDLWWILAENDVLKFNEIKKMEVAQFYTFLDKWKDLMKQKTEAAARNQNNR